MLQNYHQSKDTENSFLNPGSENGMNQWKINENPFLLYSGGTSQHRNIRNSCTYNTFKILCCKKYIPDIVYSKVDLLHFLNFFVPWYAP